MLGGTMDYLTLKIFNLGNTRSSASCSMDLEETVWNLTNPVSYLFQNFDYLIIISMFFEILWFPILSFVQKSVFFLVVFSSTFVYFQHPKKVKRTDGCMERQNFLGTYDFIFHTWVYANASSIRSTAARQATSSHRHIRT